MWMTTKLTSWYVSSTPASKNEYRTCAIINRGLNSEKTFWVIVRGYYSREVTIQEKLFCTFSMSITLFHRNFYENFQKTLGFLSLGYQDLDCKTCHWSKTLAHLYNQSCWPWRFAFGFSNTDRLYHYCFKISVLHTYSKLRVTLTLR